MNSPVSPKTVETLCRLLVCTAVCATVASTAPAQTPPFVRTVVVSPVVGDPVASGDALRSAVHGIAASPTDHWLVEVEPGLYDLGGDYLVIGSNVDVEGSGALSTTVRGAPRATLDTGAGVVSLTGSELRGLTVDCDATGSGVGCIAVHASGTPRLTGLVIGAHGGSGPLWGLYNSAAAPQIEGVKIVVTGGLEAYGMASTGSGAFRSRPVVSSSTITVKNATTDNVGVANLGESGPELLDRVSITVSGGATAAGIRGIQAAPTSDVMTLKEVTVTAFGSPATHALRDGRHTIAASLSRLNAWGTGSHGIVMPLATVRVVSSEISGTLVVASADVLELGATWLRGPGSVTGATSEACAGVFNASFVFFPNTCP